MKQCPMCSKEYLDSAPECTCGYKFAEISSSSMVATATNTEELAPSSAGGKLTTIGWVLVLAGVAASGISFALKTSVSSDLPYGPNLLEGLRRSSEVVNIGLLQQQMMVLHCGLAAALAGAIFVGLGAIANIIRAAP